MMLDKHILERLDQQQEEQGAADADPRSSRLCLLPSWGTHYPALVLVALILQHRHRNPATSCAWEASKSYSGARMAFHRTRGAVEANSENPAEQNRVVSPQRGTTAPWGSAKGLVPRSQRLWYHHKINAHILMSH